MGVVWGAPDLLIPSNKYLLWHCDSSFSCLVQQVPNCGFRYGEKRPIQRFTCFIEIVPKRTNLYCNKPRGIVLCLQVAQECGVWPLFCPFNIWARHSDLDILCVTYVHFQCARLSCALWLCLCYHVACPYCPCCQSAPYKFCKCTVVASSLLFRE